MATKAAAQAEITGANQLLLLIDFLRNVDRYEAKFRALDDMRLEVNRLVEAHGAIGEIETARAQATIDRTTAMKMLADAKARADELVTQAQQACAEMRAQAEAHAKDTTDGAKEKVAQLKDGLQQALARALERERLAEVALENALRTEANAAESIRCAHAMQAEANAAREKFEAKFNALQGALQAAE